MINFIDLIELKKLKKSLSESQIIFFIQGIINKTIPDYQISAFLMAVWFNGLTDDELYYLTKAMITSGETIDFHSEYFRPLVDKHSTGGIGDKVTIALAPILSCFNLGVTKISGRGLGFTGGTIDKLESIGVDCEISILQAKKILKLNNMFIMSQTKNLVPADKILYSLRDVTATTDSLPLIAASIISKKLAIDSDYIFIDIKYGSGSFCKTIKIANELGKMMVKLAKRFNRKIYYDLSDMNHVLGRAIGNAIEVREAVDYLLDKDDVGSDFKELMNRLIIKILITTKISSNIKDANQKLNNVLKSKQAFDNLCKWIANQGGDVISVVNGNFFKPKYFKIIKANQNGNLKYSNPVDLAKVSLELGAGRKEKNDLIDFQAGLYLNAKDGQVVKINEPVLTLYSSKPINKDLINQAKKTIKIS